MEKDDIWLSEITFLTHSAFLYLSFSFGYEADLKYLRALVQDLMFKLFLSLYIFKIFAARYPKLIKVSIINHQNLP